MHKVFVNTLGVLQAPVKGSILHDPIAVTSQSQEVTFSTGQNYGDAQLFISRKPQPFDFPHTEG